MLDQDVARLREELSAGTISPDEITRSANEYIANNQLEKAYPLVSALADCPQAPDHTVLTAGVLALALGREDAAVAFFERIIERNPDHFDANYNLFLVHFGQERTDAARRYLDRLVTTYPDNAALLSDLAVVYSNSENTEIALDYWRKALNIDPNLSLARDNAMEMCLEKNMICEGKRILRLNAGASGVSSKSIKDIEQWADRLQLASENAVTENGGFTITNENTAIRGKKIAVFASIDTFVKDIVAHLSHDNEVKTFGSGTVERMRSLMDWADIAWFEWCDNFLIQATRQPASCQIVCRLHSYEAFSDMPSQVDWSKVDLLVFVNDSVRTIVEKRFGITTPSVVIHNALDLDRFTIPNAKSYGKKIASVGYINYKKNPTLLLYAFKKIHQYDPEYTLHIAGQHQDPRLELYFDHFLRSSPLPVHFDGWVDDMPAWYADKDFVISTSLFESFHYSIAEGMACGVMPLIHNWYGAASLYPPEFLFEDPDVCLSLLQKLEQSDRDQLARTNREYILQRYNLSDKLQAISRELGKLVTSESSMVSSRE